MTDTATRLLSVLTAQFGAVETAEKDIFDAVYVRDLKPDSLDSVEVIMAIEDEFEIVIDDDEAFALDENITLRGIVALIYTKLAAKEGGADEVVNTPNLAGQGAGEGQTDGAAAEPVPSSKEGADA